MGEENSVFIFTKSKNGRKVRIPLDKLEEWKKSQENPDREKIEEVKKKLRASMDMNNN